MQLHFAQTAIEKPTLGEGLVLPYLAKRGQERE
jgi:hypothetical protein